MCRYARKKVLAETCTTGETRDSVKYYMRCKHPGCPARKTVRVFVPEFDFVVQMVTEHNHGVGVEPPKPPAQDAAQRKPLKGKPQHSEKQQLRDEVATGVDYGALPANIQAGLMLQAMSQLPSCPSQASQSHASGSDSSADTDLVLSLLAVRFSRRTEQVVFCLIDGEGTKSQ